jgi:hypothetical protein
MAWSESLDNRRPHGISPYFGNRLWERTGAMEGEVPGYVEILIAITCYDTREPTSVPSKQPSLSPTSFPTVAPTETCTAINIAGTETNYDGIYNIQVGKMNKHDWWIARDDVKDVGAETATRLYYYAGINGRRWRLEASDYSFWAPDDNLSNWELELLVNDANWSDEQCFF